MQIEIWSDVVCPFCYIGKRRFEIALNQFEHRDQLKIEWKSFQLNPNTVTDTETSVHENLAKHKGVSVEEARKMGDYVTQMAGEVGLQYNFDHAVVANTFRAHQLLHFAKAHNGKQYETKERLLQGYFINGENIDDIDTLVKIGEEMGFEADKVRQSLESNQFSEAVQTDIYEAQQLRIQGVPFFVIDRKYGISGAQSPEVILQTLEKSFAEWREKNPETVLEVQQGESCDVDGNCD